MCFPSTEHDVSGNLLTMREDQVKCSKRAREGLREGLSIVFESFSLTAGYLMLAFACKNGKRVAPATVQRMEMVITDRLVSG